MRVKRGKRRRRYRVLTDLKEEIEYQQRKAAQQREGHCYKFDSNEYKTSLAGYRYRDIILLKQNMLALSISRPPTMKELRKPINESTHTHTC